MTFENGSRLERIEESALHASGLKSIVIPSCVLVLGPSSFYGCASLKSVTFESCSRIKQIDEKAFSGDANTSNQLKSIVIPSSVVVLGKESFYWCECLESVTFEIGSRLERIDESAFSESKLKSITIPPGVALICGSAFCAQSLTSISVSRCNQHFRIRESFLEDIYGSTICRYFGSFRAIVIPGSVVDLGKLSFHDCKSLESVTFEDGSRLERIDDFAFSGSGLKSIVIPSSVVVLGRLSFFGCKSLESVTFSDDSRMERINQKAFWDSDDFPLACRFSRGLPIEATGTSLPIERRETSLRAMSLFIKGWSISVGSIRNGIKRSPKKGEAETDRNIAGGFL
jgi:hypothetical protein